MNSLVVWDYTGVISHLSSELEPLLVQLQSHGGESIVVSSESSGLIERFLKEKQLDGYFSQIYGYSPASMHWVGDPSPMKAESMGHHIHKFGPYKKVVVVGDSESDIRAGEKVSAETILFRFDEISLDTAADHVVYKLDELVTLLDAAMDASET